jgi:hypothetical protein
MKYNKNLAGTQITDELINRATSASIRLAADTILASTVVVRTAPAGGGTLLALTTDYTLGGADSRLTTEAGGTVNTTLAIVNGARLNTNLYVTYKTVGDYAEAEDVNNLNLKVDGSITVGGNHIIGSEQTVNVTAATADITIPSGLPIGTRKTIRKLHATTTSSVNILRSGSEVFTSASLTSVPIFGDGAFWVIEKVTSTRWELVGGFDSGSDLSGRWERRPSGEQSCRHNPVVTTHNAVIPYGTVFAATYVTWNYPKSYPVVPAVSTNIESGVQGIWSQARAVTTTGCSVLVLDGIARLANGVPGTAHLLAEGRWY